MSNARKPQQLRPCMLILTEAETRRVRRFVAAAGSMDEATRRLGIATGTLEAARDYGRMQGSTRERVLAALDREEGAT